MGWNSLHPTEKGKKHPLFKYSKEGDYVYFVHSFYGKDCDESLLATSSTAFRSRRPRQMKMSWAASSIRRRAGSGSADSEGVFGDIINRKTRKVTVFQACRLDLNSYGEETDMELFPAIDLRDGKAVRPVQGDYNQMTVFSDRPEEVALGFKEQGAKNLHVVDLDGAKTRRWQILTR